MHALITGLLFFSFFNATNATVYEQFFGTNNYVRAVYDDQTAVIKIFLGGSQESPFLCVLGQDQTSVRPTCINCRLTQYEGDSEVLHFTETGCSKSMGMAKIGDKGVWVNDIHITPAMMKKDTVVDAQ